MKIRYTHRNFVSSPWFEYSNLEISYLDRMNMPSILISQIILYINIHDFIEFF